MTKTALLFRGKRKRDRDTNRPERRKAVHFPPRPRDEPDTAPRLYSRSVPLDTTISNFVQLNGPELYEPCIGCQLIFSDNCGRVIRSAQMLPLRPSGAAGRSMTAEKVRVLL